MEVLLEKKIPERFSKNVIQSVSLPIWSFAKARSLEYHSFPSHFMPGSKKEKKRAVMCKILKASDLMILGTNEVTTQPHKTDLLIYLRTPTNKYVKSLFEILPLKWLQPPPDPHPPPKHGPHKQEICRHLLPVIRVSTSVVTSSC